MKNAPLAGRHFEHIENVVLCDELPSTNDVAKELVERMLGDDSDLPVTAVVTRRQTAGRGRGGRGWVSLGEGAVAVSLVVPWPEGPERVRVPVAAGIALAEGLSRKFGIDVRLKWPNDLVVGKRKLGGILVEARAAADGVGYAVIGVGLNAAADQETLDAARLPGATSLALEGVLPADVAGDSALVSVLEILDAAIASPVEDIPAGFERVSAHAVGDRLSVRDGERFSEGRYRGVTADGRLRLEIGGGVETLVSGEIVEF